MYLILIPGHRQAFEMRVKNIDATTVSALSISQKFPFVLSGFSPAIPLSFALLLILSLLSLVSLLVDVCAKDTSHTQSSPGTFLFSRNLTHTPVRPPWDKQQQEEWRKKRRRKARALFDNIRWVEGGEERKKKGKWTQRPRKRAWFDAVLYVDRFFIDVSIVCSFLVLSPV